MHVTRLSKFCDTLLEMGWLLAVIVTPLFFNVYSSRVFEPDKLTTLRTIALLMAVVWLVKVIEERAHGRRDLGFSWRTPLVPPTLFLVAVYLVTTVLSDNPWVSFFGSYQRLQGTYTTLAYIVLFFVILQGLRTRAQVERLLTVIILNSLPIALYGLVQRSQLDPLLWGEDVTRRVASNMGNAIFVAAYMIMAAPPTLSRAMDGFRSILTGDETGTADVLRAAVYIFIFMVQLIAIWYTQSRGPLMGLMAGMGIWVVLGFLGLRGVLSRRLWHSVWIGTLVTVGLVVVALLLINVGGPLREWALDTPLRPLARLLEYDRGTGMSRNLIWQGSLDLILSRGEIWYPPTEAHPQGRSDPLNLLRPLVGHGPESMYVAYNLYYPPLLGHYEPRTASPDRSHNETMDAWVTRGPVGFVSYVWLFGAVFTFGLRAMGFLPDDWRRKLFFGLLGGGAAVATAVVIPTLGAHFFGLAIPLGMVGGLFLYLVVWGFSEWNAEEPVQLHPRFVLLMGLFAAMVAHFIEINVGIAIAATNTTFWCFAGLLVVIGLGWLQEEEEAPAPVRTRKKADRKALPAWLRPTLAAAVIGGFILGTLAFDFVTNPERLTEPALIVWRALTVLPAQGGRTSYGALTIFGLTWVMSTVLFIAQMAKRGVLDERQDDWLVASSLYMLVSLVIGFGFALILAGRHAAVVSARPETVAGVLELAGTVARTLNLYYGFILFTLLLGGVVLLIGTGSAPNPVGGVSVAVLLVLGLLAWAGAVVTNLRPIQADIIFKQGNPFEAQGEWGLAIRHYQRAINLVPREDSYHLHLGRVHLEYAKALPEPAERRTALIQTERTVKRARHVNPLNTDHSANLARLYHAWAELAGDADTRQEMIQRSEENYEIATRLSPQNAILWNEWANFYLSTGQFKKAQETIAHSLEMDPGFAQTWTLQGDIHANQDRLEEALTAYETSLEVDPNQIDVWLRVGAIQREQGDLEQAVRAYERVLALRSGEVQAWRALGTLYGEAGDHEKGIEALQQALELAPADNDAWDTHRRLAILYSQTAQQEAALRHGEQALQMAPADRQRDIEEMLTQLIRVIE